MKLLGPVSKFLFGQVLDRIFFLNLKRNKIFLFQKNLLHINISFSINKKMEEFELEFLSHFSQSKKKTGVSVIRIFVNLKRAKMS
jgi:hypothetical protein